MHRKYLSLSLACLMATSTVAPAFAADVTGSSDVTLTVEAEEQPEVIQVRVPGGNSPEYGYRRQRHNGQQSQGREPEHEPRRGSDRHHRDRQGWLDDQRLQ